MSRPRQFLCALPLVFLAACFALDSDPPEHYIEGLVTDLYFTAPLPPQLETRQLAVIIRTAPLRDPVLQPAPDFTINVVTYYGFGDNYYDGSLGLTELTDPIQGETRWTWLGPVTLPDSTIPGMPGAARFVGIQIRGLFYEAFQSAPQHEYCWIAALGIGVGDCDEWIGALLQMLVQCRGIVGQFVDCHGLNWAIVPLVEIGGIGQLRGGGVMADNEVRYFMVPGLIFMHGSDGWSYAENYARTPRRGEPPPPEPTYYGPFSDPAAAARDFAERLGDRYPRLRVGDVFGPGTPSNLAHIMSDELRAMAVAIDAAMSERKQQRK